MTGSEAPHKPIIILGMYVPVASGYPPLPTPVHECRNIPPMDANGLADPYVKLRMLPDLTPSAKQKTERKDKTLDPVFEETFFL